MPKPIMMTIAVEESFFGKIYRTLDTMSGVASIAIHSEGVKGNGRAASAPQKKGGTGSVYCLVLGALCPNGPLPRSNLQAVVESAGKKASSLPDALMKAKKAKHITARGKGRDVVYTITAAGRKHFDTACQIDKGAE